MLSKSSRTLRRLLHPLIMPVVPGFMEYKHVFGSKNALLGINEPDKPLELSKEAVIWGSNHGFAEDVPATIHKKYDGNVIHTVVADPVRMDGLTEKEGLA